MRRRGGEAQSEEVTCALAGLRALAARAALDRPAILLGVERIAPGRRILELASVLYDFLTGFGEPTFELAVVELARDRGRAFGAGRTGPVGHGRKLDTIAGPGTR